MEESYILILELEIGNLPLIQKENFEDELIYSCGLKDIRELTGSRTMNDFKSDFLHIGNLAQRLKTAGFDINKLWSRIPIEDFIWVENGASYVKAVKQ